MKKISTLKRIISVGLLSLCFGGSFAFAVDPQIKEQAKETRKVFHRFVEGDDKPRLLEDSVYSEKVKEYAFGNSTENVGYAAESLYYVKKSELIEKSKTEDKSKIDTSINAVSKIIRSVSKMKGMEYYSNTRKRYEVLYKDAYRVESADSDIRIEDDLEGSSNGKTAYAMLDEHTLGKAIYKVDFLENDKTVVMTMENVTAMNYGIIKLMEPGKCKFAVVMMDDGDGYFVYIGVQAGFAKMAILEKKLNRSFQARLDALFNWITLQF